MRLMPGKIILISGETGDTGMCVIGKVRLLKLNRCPHLCLECLVELTFLRQTLLQCGCNITGKLVESALAFARAENV